ncbi:MAG: hypothetical protein Ct9H300mP25_15880 [Acidobacteriota bacterium]|nr:MAG: hypothetical protein Ct9H300mP25_15880 [Acidobacteriota bacterium]
MSKVRKRHGGFVGRDSGSGDSVGSAEWQSWHVNRSRVTARSKRCTPAITRGVISETLNCFSRRFLRMR